MFCPKCGKELINSASFCGYCGEKLSIYLENKNLEEDKKQEIKELEQKEIQSENINNEKKNASISDLDYTEIIHYISNNNFLEIKTSYLKILSISFLTFIGVVLTLAIFFRGEIIKVFPFLLLLSFAYPFIILSLSKFLAKLSHKIEILNPEELGNDTNKSKIYEIVKLLSERAGLKKIPEVGIYKSSDMNAFATGFNKNHSMVAISSGLVRNMNPDEVSAVIAHEIAHIANGDMLTSTIIQSIVNLVILVITIPLFLFEKLTYYSDKVGPLTYKIILYIKILLSTILAFFGNLIVKAFSRAREYGADKLASQLVGKQAMINALVRLGYDEYEIPKEQVAYASFKINNKSFFFEFLSTHPSLEKRINRLKSLEF